MGIESTDLWVSRKVFGQERGAEVMEHRLSGPLQNLSSKGGRLGVVRCSPSVPVHNGPIPLRLKPTPYPTELTLRKTKNLGTSTRRQMTSNDLVQNHKAITIPEAQVQHLLPRNESSNPPGTNKLRKRTFLNQLNRTFLFQYYTENPLALVEKAF
jgi:hypothetical protein